MKNKFVRFHCHTVGSVRDGLLPVSVMVSEAKKHNELVTLTDHGSLTMLMEYLNECKTQDVLPICGIEAYVNNNKFRLKELQTLISEEKNADLKKEYQIERDKKKSHAHLVIIAKNNHGLRNLIRINNYGFVNGFYGKPLITYNELFELPKDENGDRGLIISSACLGGTIPTMIMQAIETKNKTYLQNAENFIKTMKNEFKDDFYLEVQSNNIPEQKKVNKILLELAKRTKVKVVIGLDTHYLDKKSADIHQDLLLIQNKALRSNVGKIDFQITSENAKGEKKIKKYAPEASFKKGYPAEMVEVGQTFGKGKTLETILEIKEVPRVWSFTTDLVYYKSEEELRKEVKKYHKELIEDLDWIIKCTSGIALKVEPVSFDTSIKLPTVKNADSILTKNVQEALKNKNLISREYVDRVKVELKRIKENGFSEYFLILKDMIDKAVSLDIPMGCSRGSAGGSLVAFLLGIHSLNPMLPEWGGNMDFDRFLASTRNIKKVIFYNSAGEKKEFPENHILKVNRDGNLMAIPAGKVQENDKIVLLDNGE